MKNTYPSPAYIGLGGKSHYLLTLFTHSDWYDSTQDSSQDMLFTDQLITDQLRSGIARKVFF